MIDIKSKYVGDTIQEEFIKPIDKGASDESPQMNTGFRKMLSAGVKRFCSSFPGLLASELNLHAQIPLLAVRQSSPTYREEPMRAKQQSLRWR